MQNPKEVAKRVCALADDSIQINHVPAQSSVRSVERWLSPPHGWVKLNVNRGLDVKGRAGGAGVIIRRNDCSVIAEKCCRFRVSCMATESCGRATSHMLEPG